MYKVILVIFVLYSCKNSNNQENKISEKQEPLLEDVIESQPKPDYAKLKDYFLTGSDSVILVSHFSPNGPIKDPKTGKYVRVVMMVNDKFNDSIVQERKKLKSSDIQKIVDSLSTDAFDDGIRTTCFQPRHAILVYKNSNLTYLDFCFDCFGMAIHGNFGSKIVMDNKKYKRMMAIFKKHGFKYMLD